MSNSNDNREGALNLLLCTNGTPHTIHAIDLGVQIAEAIAGSVDILSIVDRQGRTPEICRIAEEAKGSLEAKRIPTAILERTPPLVDAVIQQTRIKPYDLVVIGSRGRKGVTRLLLGSVALRVSEHTPGSVLIVKGRPRPFRRFLVCSSAGPASEQTVRFAGQLARSLDATLTLLHVMSQLPIVKDAYLADLEAPAEDLIACQSREGLHLQAMTQYLTQTGLKTRAVVRHGLVQDEIITEAKEGRYDLLITGAHFTPGLDERLVNDLSADLLLAIDRPVLIVRQPQMHSSDRNLNPVHE
ncbi:MAG TPA: universal stress protein [Chloroflexi bacterium]|nr:universal stress protein [Chloroflexota bacterium]